MIDDPPVAAPAAAECPTCRAPLAADQRYCVYCGMRAPQVRLEFLETLRADAAVPPRVAAVGGGAGALPALAIVAALGVGALLGHWATAASQHPAAAVPATQVIRVTGDAAPAAAATAAPAAAAPTAAPSATATATPTAKPSKTAAPTKDLSKESIKKALKKKEPISTGGTPPPKDNKPAGGGSDSITIG
jgi:hypothetical protein